MPTPDVHPDAIAFIKEIPAKHARPILLKILDLCREPRPQDSKLIKGSAGAYLRADSGEYRILYQIVDDTLRIVLVGPRNDDEVYKQMRRQGL